MDSWWQLGESSGQRGDRLALHQITCAFCEERGNFERVTHFTKQNPRSGKTLNFDTYRCGNCVGYVMVLWSASQRIFDEIHDYVVLPWPKRLTEHPKHWPEEAGRLWVQAHRSLGDENWDAAAAMARGSMQAALRDQGATGKNVKAEIDALAAKGLLPPIMQEWSHEVRELAAGSLHPEPGQKATDPKDARDIVEFLDYLLRYLYDLPQQIQEYRERRAGRAE